MWTTTGPATNAMRPPACLDVAHHRRDARDADLDAPLRRDLVGHEREAVAIALLELRDDLDAVDAADDRRRRCGSRAACGRSPAPPSIDDRRVHALALDLDPLAAETDRGLVVGRRVEILGRAAVAIGGDDVRVLGARDAAAERDQLLEHLGQRRRRLGAVTRIETNDGSSLVRPMRNSSTSNAASWRTTVSNIAFISCESIRWPSASTTSVTACGWCRCAVNGSSRRS